jgi:O-6-methylguanine DNA methyltransferase
MSPPKMTPINQKRTTMISSTTPKNVRKSAELGVANDPRWVRVLAGDRTADGMFWYSVATTGVCCRPSCPSRAANPINVQLHDTLADPRPQASGHASDAIRTVLRSTQRTRPSWRAPDPDALLRQLQDRFPKARLIGADKDYEALVARVVGFVEAPQIGLDLPLDVRGTAFQRRVRQALQEIPVGQTVSYAEIAQRIGSPKAVRAVAGACAANNLAVAIPCHRVVRNDGALSGHAWGVERKKVLLDREGARTQ